MKRLFYFFLVMLSVCNVFAYNVESELRQTNIPAGQIKKLAIDAQNDIRENRGGAIYVKLAQIIALTEHLQSSPEREQLKQVCADAAVIHSMFNIFKPKLMGPYTNVTLNLFEESVNSLKAKCGI